MSADINTEIRVKGGNNDIVKFAKKVAKNKFLSSVTLNDEYVEELDDNELLDIIEKDNIIEAMGPYGQYIELNDTKVFEDLVDAVPNVEFSGEMTGFIYETNVSLDAKYKDNKLEITTLSYITNYNEYIKYVKSIIDEEGFAKLFKIEDLDEDAFENFFTSELLSIVNYKTFKYYFEDAMISEDEFKQAIEKLINMNIMDLNSFSEDNGETSSYIYECNSRTADDKLTSGQEFARQICPKPESIEISGKNFVHTFCTNEYELEQYIETNGGVIKSAVSSKVDYLIIGDDCNYETAKILKAKELKEKGINIIAISQSDFYDLSDEEQE